MVKVPTMPEVGDNILLTECQVVRKNSANVDLIVGEPLTLTEKSITNFKGKRYPHFGIKTFGSG